MPLLYKKLDEDIIQQKADQDQDEVTEQLHSSVEGRLCEYYITHEKEAHGKTDAPGNDNGCNMGFKDKKTQAEVLFMEDKIKADPVHNDISNGIGASAGRITKSL